jgi:uncharacterized protein (TIGR03000 family)
MILMAALTSGGSTPDCHFRCGCHGGCYGGCYGGCHGCYGCSGCYGCWGGYGCWGSCHGGCWGSGYGACYGTCYGGWGYGVYGCVGSWGYGSWGSAYACYGSWAHGPGYYGSNYETMTPGGVAPSYVPGTPMPPATGGSTAPGEQLPKPQADKSGTSLAPNRARLIVELPADAKLYIDERPMKTTSGRRTFHTPALQSGQTYYYMLRAEVVRDGKPVREERRVILRPGEVVRTDFNDLAPRDVTASAR